MELLLLPDWCRSAMSSIIEPTAEINVVCLSVKPSSIFMAVTIYGGYVYNMYDFLFLPLPFLLFMQLFHTHIFISLAQFVLVGGSGTWLHLLRHWGLLVVGDTSVSLWTIKWLWIQEEAAVYE